MNWERFSCLQEKEVINICDGCRLGCVSDVVIDLKCGRVAALVVPDREAVARVFSEAGRLLAADAVRSEMEKNIRALAVADSADRVADEILKVVRRSE